MNNLIEENCKRCINYEICQSTGCGIKSNIERLQQENQQLKEDFIPKLQATKNRLDKNNHDLTMELQQRDKVINKAIEYIKCHAVYDKEELTNFANNLDQEECNELLDILNKYKGEINNA